MENKAKPDGTYTAAPADETDDRLARRQKTLDFLTEHGIGYELYTHPPLPTVKDALEYWKNVEATHCKNLFFRNHKGNRHYLVVLECHKDLDIHGLEHLLHQGKLSFASPERMKRCLGLKPGSVSPLGLINDIGIRETADPKELFDNGHRVKLFLDSDLRKAVKLSFHPCENTSGAVLAYSDFLRKIITFVKSTAMKRLIRIIATVILLTVIPLTASAEGFGIKGGVNISSLRNVNAKDFIGYQAGLLYQADLPLWFSVQPELLFHVKGARINETDNSFGLGYLEVPVHIQWGPRFKDGDIRVFAQGSPYIGYAISKDMQDSEGNQYSWKNLNRLEYGVAAGIGIQLWHFQITGQYNWSLGNLANMDLAEQAFKDILNESNFSGYTISLAIVF